MSRTRTALATIGTLAAVTAFAWVPAAPEKWAAPKERGNTTFPTAGLASGEGDVLAAGVHWSWD